MSLLDIALQNAEKGNKVFPCVPGDKNPLTEHGFKDATTDENQIREWWTKWPSANIAIACGASGLSVMDVDHGLTDADAFKVWREAAGIPETYTVRTGRRDSFGVQMYFIGAIPDVGLWDLGGCQGQIKGLGGYVMAAGSIHPSGAAYEVISDAPLAPVPDVVRNLSKKSGAVVGVPANDFKLRRLLGFLEHYEIPLKDEPTPTTGGWRIDIDCPWAAEHSGEGPRETSVFWSPIRGFGFKCLHGHCDGRNWHTLTAEMEKRFPDKPRYFGKLPLMTHADIARHFVESNDDFVSIYDLDGRPLASFVGTRWDIRNDVHLLRKAVRDFLDELFHRYPLPEEGKPDYRLKLKSANYADSVTREVRPLLPPVHSSTFDRNPYLLGLPGGYVVELDTSVIRTVRREDGLTKRVNVMPVKMQTERFDRFIREITCGDVALGEYILRFMALCLTGMPVQILFFLWGRGRNGKGVLVRLLGKLLGAFFFPLRTNDLTISRMSGDAEKKNAGKVPRHTRCCAR